MKKSVQKVFPSFTSKFEGRINCMYLDILGLVTSGFGCLIDPLALAMPLIWMKKDGSQAKPEDITAEWNRVKAMQDKRMLGVKVFQDSAELTLPENVIDTLCSFRANLNSNQMRKAFPEYDNWPADAQLGVMSIAWAAGTGVFFNGGFPKFVKAANSGDWVTAAKEGQLNAKGNAGLVPRNKVQVLCFNNAATVAKNGSDTDILYWPNQAK